MVIIGWITLFNNSNYDSLRVIRILKPLKTISQFPYLKKVVNSILSSFSMIGDIALIMFYYVVIFSIIGQQLFQGVLK